MTWGRLAVAACLVWLAIFIILHQPQPHRLPIITHAHLLEPTAGDLPTLAPPG